MGGEFVDSARGTLTATVLVPQLQIQASLLGDLYFQLFVVLYVLAGGHLFFLSAVLDSYRVFPPAGALPAAALVNESFLKMTLAMLRPHGQGGGARGGGAALADVVLGVANRVASQMDVFFLGLGSEAGGGPPRRGPLLLRPGRGLDREAFVGFHAWLLSWLRHG